ncbi:hypothetical protein SLE2022_318330 [Rubroshorea leprosula]
MARGRIHYQILKTLDLNNQKRPTCYLLKNFQNLKYATLGKLLKPGKIQYSRVQLTILCNAYLNTIHINRAIAIKFLLSFCKKFREEIIKLPLWYRIQKIPFMIAKELINNHEFLSPFLWLVNVNFNYILGEERCSPLCNIS